MSDDLKKERAEEVKVETNNADVQTKKFIEEYGELVQKYNRDFASYPAFMPDGKGGFSITLQSVPIDVTDRPKPSPFIEKE